jgi:hypothetical protein
MDARSSSSSDADPSFRRFLDRSLVAIENEAPEVHRALCRSLARSVVRLCIDDERMVLLGGRERLAMSDDVPGATVEFATNSATLLALTSGATSFLDAALADRMIVKGAVDEMVGFYEALVLYLQGAVRSPSLPWLLEEFECTRRASAPQPDGEAE